MTDSVCFPLCKKLSVSFLFSFKHFLFALPHPPVPFLSPPHHRHYFNVAYFLWFYTFTAVQHERSPRVNSQYKPNTNLAIAVAKPLKRKHDDGSGGYEAEVNVNEVAVSPKKEKYHNCVVPPESHLYSSRYPLEHKNGFSSGLSESSDSDKGGLPPSNMTPPHTPQQGAAPANYPLLYMPFPEMVYESAIRVLYMTVKWVRNIPTFLDLPFRDQAILLEESWSELFVLSIAQWKLPIDTTSLLAASGMNADLHSRSDKLLGGMSDIRTLQSIITRFKNADIDQTEYACLKAIILFKPGKYDYDGFVFKRFMFWFRAQNQK